MKRRIWITAILVLLFADISFSNTSTDFSASAKKYTYTSFYYTTRDNVNLAVDVFLPRKLQVSDKIPAILYMTRYVRSVQLKGYARWLKRGPILGQIRQEEIEMFTSNGYACVIVDARGSGASGGKRNADFSPDEIEDAREILDWIVNQTWSNGRVGTTGVSYVGTTAEMILMTGHPALKACVPRSNIFDIYADMTHPGGIRQAPFLEIWGTTTSNLDNNDFAFLGMLKRMFVSGINPVATDKKKQDLKLYLSERPDRNYNVLKSVSKIDFRDDIQPDVALPIDTFSIHKGIPKIVASGVPILRIGGWYDGALSASLIKGYMNTPNTETAIMGPWDHGPRFCASPYAADAHVKEDLYAIILNFFNKYLKEGRQPGLASRKMVYYTVGAERWDTTEVWPVSTEAYQFYFAANHTLANKDPRPYTYQYDIDYTAGSGGGSRWNSQTPAYRYDKMTRYPDRAAQTAKNIIFDSPALKQKMHILGHAQVVLRIKYDQPEGQVFVYFDDVAPDGTIRYITEGMLKVGFKDAGQKIYNYPAANISFKKEDYSYTGANEWVNVVVDMLPISYEIPEGHQLRISIAGADAEHFELPVHQPKTMDIQVGGNTSFVKLPLLKKNSFF